MGRFAAKMQRPVLALALLALTGFWDLRAEASGVVTKKDGKPPAPTPPPTDPAPCCSEESPICACNQCVTQEELALVSCLIPEDDPDSINNCCGTPLPFPIAECCTNESPICSCVGCVSQDELAAITCPADPPEPFDCCENPGGGGELPGTPPNPPPTDPAPCCSEESPICACNQCVTQEELALVSCLIPEDDPDSINNCCGTPLPFPVAKCCTNESPICSCAGCVNLDELAAITCLADPPEPFDCCANPGGGGGLPGPPPTVPPGPFDGEDCCDEESLCCCGACLAPEVCAATTCQALPGDLPDDYRPCCGDPITPEEDPEEDPDEDPEEDPKEDPEEDPAEDPEEGPEVPIGGELPGPPDFVPPGPFDGEDCCDEESLCCCGRCRAPEVCAVILCEALPDDLPDDYRPCCGDPITPEEPPAPPPKPPVKPDECCPEDKPKCACGSCVFDPDNQLACKPAPGWDGDCCPDEPEPAAPPPKAPPPVIAECCTEDAPACCCGGCATQDFCNVVDCLPDAPAGCCGDEGPNPPADPPMKEPPMEEPPVKPLTCCKEGSQCCCGGCMSPLDCARIRCIPDPEDDGTCCPAEGKEPDDEEPEVEEPKDDERGFERTDCCTGFEQCCCGRCRSSAECAKIDCFVFPDNGPETCCGDEEEPFDFKTH